MALYSKSFLQILQDETPVTFENSTVALSRCNSIHWDDDEESFEVSEVPNGASGDVNLAEALRSIDAEVAENRKLESVAQIQSHASVRTGPYGDVKLKEELRAKIQTRRLSEGVGELRVQFEPPKSYPILQDETPVTFENSTVALSRCNSIHWDDDEESFEVSEVPNGASGDVNLAAALRSIDAEVAENRKLESVAQIQSRASVRTGPYGDVKLKEELRAKIQTRRLSEGVGELRVQFEPPKSYPLTPEENEKVQKRKRRNRLSANKSRIKRKEREDALLKEVADLEKANGSLSKEIKVLKNLKNVLYLKIASHQCNGQEVASSSSMAMLSIRNSVENVNMQRLTRHRTNSDFAIKPILSS